MKRLYRGRPRNVAPGDTRSPMLRLLAGARNGYVEVQYAAQWPTILKAERLGLVDDGFPARLTDAGHAWLAKQGGKA